MDGSGSGSAVVVVDGGCSAAVGCGGGSTVPSAWPSRARVDAFE